MEMRMRISTCRG